MKSPTAPDLAARARIIVALDFPTAPAALALVQDLAGQISFFKIGLQLFTAAGPAIVQAVRATGAGVFLDLKLHDIPNTVGHAVSAAAALGVEMLTLHLSGGVEMAAAAASAAQDSSMLLLGVTVLTSSNQETLTEIGVSSSLEDQVRRLAAIARDAGLGGVVASPHEVQALRQEFGRELKIVTPGVRPAWAAAGDQKRFTTPRQAVDAGADYLVIGRPITAHADPRRALELIIEELEG